MFRELMPLLNERTVMMTLSRVDDRTMRVCVIPKRIKQDVKDNDGENALCSPLAVTGTMEELDRDFAAQLSQYTNSITTLGSNFAEIQAAHQAATKALKEENKKELDRQRGKSSTKVTASPKPLGPSMKDGKPVFGTKSGAAVATTPPLSDSPTPDSVITNAGGSDAARNDGSGTEPPPAEERGVEPPPASGTRETGQVQSLFNYPD